MDLLVAAIVLLLLLAASYSGRRTWAAIGSTAVSITLITGICLLATAQHTGPFLGTLSPSLPGDWNRHARDLAEAMTTAATSLASPARDPSPHRSASVSAASTTEAPWLDIRTLNRLVPTLGRLDPGGQPGPEETRIEESSDEAGKETLPLGAAIPVRWILDASDHGGEPVLLTGLNVSSAPLEDIRAVLKPDWGGGATSTIPLTLQIEGRAVEHNGRHNMMIPPRTRFHLIAPASPQNQMQALGGAFVSFAYKQADRRRTSIFYLKPAVLAERIGR